MGTFEQFEQDLHNGLAHLYDPTYQPSALLQAVLGQDARQGTEAVQATLIQTIEELVPGPQVPATARSRRIYELLHTRYIQNLCQEEAAEKLGITSRHLRREQQQAIRVLAKRLWEASQGDQAEPTRQEHSAMDAGAVSASSQMPGGEATDEVGTWRSQVQQEIACLQKGAPGGATRIAETMQGVMEMARPLIAKRGIGLRAYPVEPRLTAAIHPSGLRPTLLAGIMELARNMTSGEIVMGAERRLGRVAITLSANPLCGRQAHGNDLEELLAAQGGTFASVECGTATSFELTLPSVEKTQVLVIDDNADLVHFYDLYTAGTQYQITNIQEGEQVFEAIAASLPGIIVLDVMLPDMDGWELLSQLHEAPNTRAIPVIVCSVVREEELALSLGAALYVAKPVRRQQFLAALDQALNRAAIAAETDRASNGAAC